MPPSKSEKLTYNLRNNKKKMALKKKRSDPDSDDDDESIELGSEDTEEDEDEDEDDEEEEDEYETCSESSYVPSVKSAKKSKAARKRKQEEEEDEDDDDFEVDSDGEIDEKRLRKTLSKIFPSKYMNEKVRRDKKSSKKSKKRTQDEEEDEDDEDDDDERDDKLFSIVFTSVDDPNFEDDIAAIEEDGELDSGDEETFMKENYEKVECPVDPSSATTNEQSKSKKTKGSKKSKSGGRSKSEKSDKSEEYNPEENQQKIELEYAELVETKKHLIEKLEKNPKSKILRNAVQECKEEIKKLVKKSRVKNAKEYYKLINDDLECTNEIDYFKRKLSSKEQLKVMNQMKMINKHLQVEKPYRLTLLDSNIPPKFKATVLQKLNILQSMEPTDNEYYKMKNWVDTFMRVPFTSYKSVSVNLTDGLDACHTYMENARQILDTCVYGLDDAKLQILQMVGQWISNPSAMGTAIAIHGPMGTGKCHGYNTPILMHDGSVKMVQDIVIGDVIMGDNSTPRQVMSLGRGQDQMYEVISNKGTKYTVNSEHILCLKPSGMNRIKVMRNDDGEIRAYKASYFNLSTCKYSYKTFVNQEEAEAYIISLEGNQKTDIVEISVKNYLNLPRHIQLCLKGYSTGVEFEPKPVLFDPYIIGVWLGDGCSSQAKITNQDSAILNYMRIELKKDNLDLRHLSKYDYNIVSDEYNRPHPGISKKTGYEYENKNIFLETLRHYDLIDNKHIPDSYKTNDRNVRLQILAGLIDTDGWFNIDDRYFEITQKSKRLSDDIVFIARSLGFAATQNECEKYCVYKGERRYGLYYRVNIYGEGLDQIPTKCPRKKVDFKERHKNALVSAIEVVPLGMGNYYGFELDGNHRYVLGNFTVTHNTSIIKDGISKILGREFAFIALGGAGDSSFLEGHSYTYEGSTWGKIVQILIDSKCMNPIIYFDELDKVSDTPRGQEIIGILTHLTDTTQNSQFHDKYFSEIDFDLSKCLFIFSYNDESKVNPILKDRMYRIQTKGYEAKEKVKIARDYLLPKIREQVNFTEEEIIIPDETIQYIVSTTFLTKGEAGVRNLKRCLEIIYTKLNLFRLVKSESSTFFKDMDIKVEFPFTVTKKHVDILIKNEENQNQSLLSMYV